MIDLKKYCRKDGQHMAVLAEPFRSDGYIAASDAGILVAIPDDGRECNSKNAPKIASLLAPADEPVYKIRGIDFGLSAPIVCESCNGAGAVPKYKKSDCKKCFGSGDVVCDMGHVHECPAECENGKVDGEDQDGTQPCLDCNGLGEAVNPVQVAARFFDRRYLAMLVDLPDCVASFPLEVADESVPQKATFTFDGGIGTLMSLRMPA